MLKSIVYNFNDVLFSLLDYLQLASFASWISTWFGSEKIINGTFRCRLLWWVNFRPYSERHFMTGFTVPQLSKQEHYFHIELDSQLRCSFTKNPYSYCNPDAILSFSLMFSFTRVKTCNRGASIILKEDCTIKDSDGILDWCVWRSRDWWTIVPGVV